MSSISQTAIATTEPRKRIDFDGLRKVIDAVRGAPEAEFDMERWGMQCGTSACAIGWFCRANPQDDLFMSAEGPKLWIYPHEYWFDAIATRFGISLSVAFRLFDPGEYGPYRDPDKSTVIARIQQVIDEASATVAAV